MGLALVRAGSRPAARKQTPALYGARSRGKRAELLRIAASHTGGSAVVWHPGGRPRFRTRVVCQHSRNGGILHQGGPVGATERALFLGRLLRRRLGGV